MPSSPHSSNCRCNYKSRVMLVGAARQRGPARGAISVHSAQWSRVTCDDYWPESQHKGSFITINTYFGKFCVMNVKLSLRTLWSAFLKVSGKRNTSQPTTPRRDTITYFLKNDTVNTVECHPNFCIIFTPTVGCFFITHENRYYNSYSIHGCFIFWSVPMWTLPRLDSCNRINCNQKKLNFKRVVLSSPPQFATCIFNDQQLMYFRQQFAWAILTMCL